MCGPSFLNFPMGEIGIPNLGNTYFSKPRNLPKVKRGRKPKYDWEAARRHVEELFDFNGALMPGDDCWSCQADVERSIQAYFINKMGCEPATSTVRPYAKKFIKEFMDENSRN